MEKESNRYHVERPAAQQGAGQPPCTTQAPHRRIGSDEGPRATVDPAAAPSPGCCGAKGAPPDSHSAAKGKASMRQAAGHDDLAPAPRPRLRARQPTGPSPPRPEPYHDVVGHTPRRTFPISCRPAPSLSAASVPLRCQQKSGVQRSSLAESLLPHVSRARACYRAAWENYAYEATLRQTGSWRQRQTGSLTPIWHSPQPWLFKTEDC